MKRGRNRSAENHAIKHALTLKGTALLVEHKDTSSSVLSSHNYHLNDHDRCP
jgi:hypothetical protein